jgi:hypothetical protein
MSEHAKPDVRVHNEETIFVFMPLTKATQEWIESNVCADDWQWFYGGLCVEHRYARDLADGMTGDGLVVE